MKRQFAAGLFALSCLTAAPALSAPPEQKDPETLASEGLQSLLKAMEMMLMAIPQYEAPYVNENGDIIIRRKNPAKPRDDGPQPEDKRKSI